MKEKYLELLQWKLRLFARLMIWRYEPKIVAVAGSVGKTSTKYAIASVLRGSHHIRMSPGNFNNEIGVPLTILSDEQEIGGIFFWFRVFSFAIWRIIFKGKYPDVLILEYATDRPGDMKYLLKIARPTHGVLTAFGEIPVHVEFFSSPEELAREDARAIEYLSAYGFALLNFDDQTVLDMKDRTRAKVITYGFGDGADIKISNFEHRAEDGAPAGISFKLEYGGSFVPVRMNNVYGKPTAYSAAAAAGIGLIFGMNLVNIPEALSRYEAPKGRMSLLKGIKGTYILDDSYNAAPLSMHAALETLKDLEGERKIAVLGDMLEIGQYAIEAHEQIGRFAKKCANILITVGARAMFIADEAKKLGMPAKNVFSFDTADEAKLKVQEVLKQGDVVLVKASRSIGLEKVVEEIREIS